MPVDYISRAIINIMETAGINRKITRITEPRLWDRFTDSLVTSSAILGLVVVLSYFSELPILGFPAGTAVAAAFATMALSGQPAAFPRTELEGRNTDQFMVQAMLAMAMGFLLSFIGRAFEDRTVFIIAGAMIVPIATAYPLLQGEPVYRKGVVRNVFKPTFPHIVLWVVELSCPDILSAVFLGGVCTIIEEFSFLVRTVDDEFEKEHVDEFRRIARALCPTFLVLAGTALMCAEGASVKTCTLMVLGLGAGLLAGKAVGIADIIQLTVGVAVASAITLMAYI